MKFLVYSIIFGWVPCVLVDIRWLYQCVKKSYINIYIYSNVYKKTCFTSAARWVEIHLYQYHLWRFKWIDVMNGYVIVAEIALSFSVRLVDDWYSTGIICRGWYNMRTELRNSHPFLFRINGILWKQSDDEVPQRKSNSAMRYNMVFDATWLFSSYWLL